MTGERTDADSTPRPDPETARAIDKSDPDHTGAPRRMASQCVNCGRFTTAGCVTVWLDIEDGRSKPRDDVRFKCIKGCGDVAAHQIRILERWPGETDD